jgi:glycosyltransferase involved in cell wall biosynthesis
MYSQRPTVSVVIPTYNRAYIVDHAIKSVLSQTYRDLELIVVDDGSTDNTEQIVREGGDHRIRYLRHEKNQGMSAARNTGIRASSGEYIAFQDSDDVWVPEKLQKQMEVFGSLPGKVGVVYSGLLRINNGNKRYIPYKKNIKVDGFIHDVFLDSCLTNLPTAVVRKSCFEKSGMFDEYLFGLEDMELFFRISKFYEFKFLKETLVFSHLLPDSISFNIDALIKSSTFILDKYFKEFSKKKGRLSKRFYSLGHVLCESRDFARGKEYLFKSVKACPSNGKALLAYLLSLSNNQKFYQKMVRSQRVIRQKIFKT